MNLKKENSRLDENRSFFTTFWQKTIDQSEQSFNNIIINLEAKKILLIFILQNSKTWDIFGGFQTMCRWQSFAQYQSTVRL